MRQRLVSLGLLGLLSVLGAPAAASTATYCPDDSLRAHPPQVNFRVDNDLFGGKAQDQGYSNGAQLTLVSPNLLDYTDDPCLPKPARWINRHLEQLHAGRFDQQNMLFSLAQRIYTPKDSARQDLIEQDRPYAGVLIGSFGYNARRDNHLQTTQLTLGVVGPWAQGKQVQGAVHDLLGGDRFQGWDNQLHNEPVVMLTHERMQRWPADDSHRATGWGWDAISHYGGALGNLSTRANAGAELRVGWKLPDDFGSTPLRPAGENTAPTRSGRTTGWSWHAFMTANAAWVVRDITLDGNTWRNSHRVDKRHAVALGGYGLGVVKDRWKFALARYHSTREFDGQRQPPVFGSFTISRAL